MISTRRVLSSISLILLITFRGALNYQFLRCVNNCPKETACFHRTRPQSKETSSTRLYSSVNDDGFANSCRIKVIGVGGGGGNAVNRMIDSAIDVKTSIEFWIVNTDTQALSRSKIQRQLNIGKTTSRLINPVTLV